MEYSTQPYGRDVIRKVELWNAGWSGFGNVRRKKLTKKRINLRLEELHKELQTFQEALDSLYTKLSKLNVFLKSS